MEDIKLTKVSKSFGKVEALKEIDLALHREQVLGFIGPNGAGKTTTLRVILGMIRAQGSAKVFGLDAWKDAAEIHKKLAYVSGDVNFWPNLTGGQVIDIFLRLKKQKNKKYKEDLIEKFNLDPSKKCRTYSKGNRQKVALIAALSSDAQVFLLDEPTSGLDPLMEATFQEEIIRLKKEGKSILLSSHILSEVEKLCDTISIIRQGKIIETGRLEDMRHLTLLKVRVRTEKPAYDFNTQASISSLEVEDDLVTFQALGSDIGQVLRELEDYGVITLESQPPSLEELFMSHYQ